MNLKNLSRICLIAATIAMAGCATNRVDPLTQGPDMKAVVEPATVAGLPVPKGQKIFVRFDESQPLARQVMHMLEQRGHTIAATESDANVIVKTRSAYSYVRRQARRVTVSMGKLLDGADMKTAFSQLDNQAARIPYTNLNTAAMYMGGSMSTSGLVGATVVETLLGMSGVGAAFNKALVGDERGICIPMGPGGCDNWKKYEQILVLETEVSSSGRPPASFVTRARTLSEDLKPMDLFNEVMPAYFTTMAKE